jgi:hypothetical protein
VAVGFVGLKLLVLTSWEHWRHTPLISEHWERIGSIAITLSLIVLPVVVKALLDLWRKPAQRPSD